MTHYILAQRIGHVPEVYKSAWDNEAKQPAAPRAICIKPRGNEDVRFIRPRPTT